MSSNFGGSCSGSWSSFCCVKKNLPPFFVLGVKLTDFQILKMLTQLFLKSTRYDPTFSHCRNWNSCWTKNGGNGAATVLTVTALNYHHYSLFSVDSRRVKYIFKTIMIRADLSFLVLECMGWPSSYLWPLCWRGPPHARWGSWWEPPWAPSSSGSPTPAHRTHARDHRVIMGLLLANLHHQKNKKKYYRKQRSDFFLSVIFLGLIKKAWFF